MNSLEKFRWCFDAIFNRYFKFIFVNIAENKITNIWGYQFMFVFSIVNMIGCLWAFKICNELAMSPIYCLELFFGTLQVCNKYVIKKNDE